MKKIYTILAIAAVAAVGCSKTELGTTENKVFSDEKINFEVASFMDQTKAAGEAATTLNAEGFTTFYTYANFFQGTTKQVYMDNVAINYSESPKQWAPARDYYWPKAADSYINFYSYVNTASQDPAITFNSEKTVATATYEDKTIAATDNILLADAALKQNGNLTEYTSISGVTSGVPTLFRHLLAKVNFKIKLVTTDEKKSASTKFVVTILNAGETLSNIKADQKGSYVATNTFDDVKHTLAWTAPVVWTPSTTPQIETISFLTPELTLPVNSTSSGEYVDLLKERTVMPQTLDADNDFTLSYKVETYYGSEATPYMTENFKVTGKIATLVNTITAWNKNTKITYNITIDPVGNKVTFDPAVEEWGTGEGQLAIPLS
jgi:archaellum component FlaF (FlaF/FlaG flagellin family)